MIERLTRQAQSEDIPALKGVLTSAVEFKAKHHDDSWGEGAFTDEEVTELLKSGTVYCLEEGGEIIGTVALTQDDHDQLWSNKPGDANYLRRLATKEGHHSTGVGKQLIDCCIQQTRQDNRHLLRLDCDEDNLDLCNYYEKAGFTQVGSKLKNNGKTAALFERRV